MKTSQTGGFVSVLILMFALGALGGCAQERSGASLPEHSFQFPTGLVVHPSGYALVVCSNFDLAFSSGSLRVIDLNRLGAKDLAAIPVDSDYHEDVIRNDLALGLDNFGSSIALSDDGQLAAITVRETDELVLVDLDFPPAGGSGSSSLSCWSTNNRPNEKFPFCEGSRHLVPLMNMLVEDKRAAGVDYDLSGLILRDPIDVLLSGEAESRKALVTFLGSGYVTAIGLPANEEATAPPPELAFYLNSQMRGLNEMARSPVSGMVYVTTRSGISTTSPSNPIHYFDPSLGSGATIRSLDLYKNYLGSESRGIAFGPDGYTLGVLVRNPDMLLLLDSTPDLTGFPSMGFLGVVPVSNDPTLLRSNGDLMFVTGTKDDSIFVIDVTTQKLIARLESVCRGPFDMGFYEKDENHWALVTCFENDNVTVLDVNPESSTFLNVVARIGEPVDKD